MSGGDWKDLYKGVQEGNIELVEFHIKNGIDLNYQHPEILMTPLVTAIQNKHDEIAILLLKSGANPWLESYYDNMNAVEAALNLKNEKILKVIEERGHTVGFKVRLKTFLKRIF